MISTDQFYRKGVLYAVIYNDEDKEYGLSSTDIVAESIDEALKNGLSSPKEIAHHLVTSSFKHVKNRAVQFNSLLKAGESVGANIPQKLGDAILEVARSSLLSLYEGDKGAFKIKGAIAVGMIMSQCIVLNPFSFNKEDDSNRIDLNRVKKMALNKYNQYTDMVVEENYDV